MQNPANPKFEIRNPQSSSPGLWSELRFRLRRPLGILTGTIDKLIITPAANGNGIDVEVIDFKTNRFRLPSKAATKLPQSAGAAALRSPGTSRTTPPARRVGSQSAQGLFDFDSAPADVLTGDIVTPDIASSASAGSVDEQVQTVAHDYQLQMQAYALALRELLPEGAGVNSLRATLHFIEPNIEVAVSADLLEPGACARMIDDAMLQIASLDGTLDAEAFSPVPAPHCRMCNFLELCPAGRDWLKQN